MREKILIMAKLLQTSEFLYNADHNKATASFLVTLVNSDYFDRPVAEGVRIHPAALQFTRTPTHKLSHLLISCVGRHMTPLLWIDKISAHAAWAIFYIPPLNISADYGPVASIGLPCCSQLSKLICIWQVWQLHVCVKSNNIAWGPSCCSSCVLGSSRVLQMILEHRPRLWHALRRASFISDAVIL